ncbi:phosphatidylinositol 4-kinase, putative [Ichthyophthirius multifiliis]|uniref:1-phosphatidylinositol 4-kinase n=1 Tax=Ichthyophthirius multifiliis TaxID=5932 RepID=G0QKS1_ICHMU|nr:phosphatidylinositol 4-kinase, putative [Ichthyophthirius multifiliis]EGR34193.1 phosphatidylinositol 4-kinase, putative [Ichthyophthirius multifiliis]|eukprot:XP_004039497.1 phosphatidylinositol 4-kinase, putative [Ichthyophthirius multifiliis]
MVKISLTLKKHPIENRKSVLKDYMIVANKWLRQLKNKQKGNNLFQGICVPFRKEMTSQFNSNFIVRIIENEFTCFNTKMRVLYRVVVETVDIKDFDTFKKKKNDTNELDETQSSINNDDFVVEEEIDDNFEQIQQNTKEEKINKYQNFDKWAKQQEEEEENINKIVQEVKKGLTFKSLINKTENQTSIQNFHNLFLRKQSSLQIQEQLIKHEKKKIHIQQTIIDPQRKIIYENNLKRFNIYFKPKKRNTRRHSVYKEINIEEQKRDIKQENKKKSVKLKDLKIKDVLEFFHKIMKEFPSKKKHIQMIYRYLHYDIIEQKILTKADDNIGKNQKMNTVEFPRKFGPWEDIWEDKMEVIRQNSPFSHFESYQIRSVIFKGGDDLRQELLAMQLICKFQAIFQKAGLPLWLRPYEIIATSASSGILEFLPNTLSIDGLKKKVANFTNLMDFYQECFGEGFEKAQKNFIDSLAGYSVVCYLLQFKDRHNGNILIDNKGYLIHIDYGFMFSISPGGINFENAPFKLTKEYVQLMGGKNSDLFKYFKNIVFMGFQELQKYVDEIVFLVEIMMEQSDLPCFYKFDIGTFRERFKENLDQKALIDYSNKLVEDSYDNWRTKQYDNFQKMTNGIMP